jgi:nitronate monooxygenase
MWTRTRVASALGIRLPIIQGPFGGGLSSTKLAAAVSNAGGLGSYGAGQLEAAKIGEVVSEIRKLTVAPFAINLWVPLPGESEAKLSRESFERATARLKPYYDELGISLPEFPERFSPSYEAQIEAMLAARPPVFSFVFGIPSAGILAECQKLGIKTVGTITHVDEAIAMEAAGVDVIVASGSEAGGHRTAFMIDPLEAPSLSALIPQVADKVRTPLVAAGGMVDGRSIAAALAWGAQGVQVGTAFLACRESGASEAHRAAIRSPAARYTRLTRAFSGRYARGIRNRLMTELDRVERELPPYPIQNWLTGPIRKAAAAQGRAEFLALWAGQNAPLVRHEIATELMGFLVDDTTRLLNKA